MQRKNIDKISSLDGIRGLAALAVFGVHFNQAVQFDAMIGNLDIGSLLAKGDHGVAVFFTLSGLLLSLPFWREKLNRQQLPNLKSYALKRTARILPAYYFVLTVLLLLSGLWRYPEAATDIVLHYLFLFNLTEFSIFSINPVFWTIAIEVQFYLLLPLLFIVLRRVTAGKALWLLLLFAAGSYLCHYGLFKLLNSTIPWPGNPWLTWLSPYGAVLHHSLPGQLPNFLLGVFAGYFFPHMEQLKKLGKLPGHCCEVIFWVSLSAAILLLLSNNESALSLPYGPYGFPGLPLLLGLTVFCAPFTKHAKKLLDSAPLKVLGLLSYGIYLYHVPCLNYLYQLMTVHGLDIDRDWWLFGIASILLTLLVATLSYYLLERPALNLAKRKR